MTEAVQKLWWLEEGEGTCGFCPGSFQPQALYHCCECDRPVCMTCMISAPDEAEVRCPECGGA